MRAKDYVSPLLILLGSLQIYAFLSPQIKKHSHVWSPTLAQIGFLSSAPLAVLAFPRQLRRHTLAFAFYALLISAARPGRLPHGVSRPFVCWTIHSADLSTPYGYIHFCGLVHAAFHKIAVAWSPGRTFSHECE